MRRKQLSAALLLSALAGTAHAQSGPPVVLKRLDDGSGEHRSELALRVSKVSPDIIAVWHEHPEFPDSNIFYNVSIDGFSFREDPGVIPLPSCWTELQGCDPMVAFDITGKGYLGYAGSNPSFAPQVFYDRFWIAVKEMGEEYANVASPSIYPTVNQMTGRVDKGVLAAGPAYGASGDMLGLAFVANPTGGFGNYQPKCTPQPPQFDPCETNSAPTIYDMREPNTYAGAPNDALILRGGTADERWLVAWYFDVTVGNDTFTRNGGVYSNNGGVNWQNSVDPTRVTKVNTNDQEDIKWKQTIEDSETLAEIRNFPQIAQDPSSPNKVYMAFGASAESDPNNRDIFIAQSLNGGQNFSTTSPDPAGSQVLRLTDGDLGDDAGSVQFLPTITVDEWGGVHLMYYVGKYESSHWVYKVKMAHIPSFSTWPRPSASTVDLTSYWFNLDHSSIWRGFDQHPWIGDYMNSVDVRGCQIIAGFIAPPSSTTAPVAVYAAFVLNPNSICALDPECYVNCDGSTTPPIVNINDFICFAERFANGQTYANCDGSTGTPLLTVNDFVCFMSRYATGCE